MRRAKIRGGCCCCSASTPIPAPLTQISPTHGHPASCLFPSLLHSQLQELCGFLEEQMGLVKGWLLSVPASLYLYVSPTKRILGCVVAEGIKEAFPVVPQLQPEVAAQVRIRSLPLLSLIFPVLSSSAQPLARAMSVAALGGC